MIETAAPKKQKFAPLFHKKQKNSKRIGGVYAGFSQKTGVIS